MFRAYIEGQRHAALVRERSQVARLQVKVAPAVNPNRITVG